MQSIKYRVSLSPQMWLNLAVIENMEVDRHQDQSLANTLEVGPWFGNQSNQVEIVFVQITNPQIVVICDGHVISHVEDDHENAKYVATGWILPQKD